MKQSKLTAIIIAATALWLNPVYAQNNQTPPAHHQGGHQDMSPQDRFNQLSQELNLSPDQKPRVQAVFEDMFQNIRTAVEEARTNADTQLQQILTPEQYQQLQTLWDKHQKHFEHHMGNGGGPNTSPNGSQGQ